MAVRRAVFPRWMLAAAAVKKRPSAGVEGRRRRQRRHRDVFINHRGVDTKRTIAGLLYDRLALVGLRPFMDNRSMQPGDKLYDSIEAGIRGCKVGVAIFSPRYCDSYFCLHELTMLVEAHKSLIPIFCDVKPSELLIEDDGTHPPQMIERFRAALKEAKFTVGLTFDSQTGDWSDLVTRATDLIVQRVKEEDRKNC